MSNCKITYNGNVISETEETPPVSVTYNGSTICTLTDNTNKTLLCNGKYMNTNVVVGSKTLNCLNKIMSSNVLIELISALIEDGLFDANDVGIISYDGCGMDVSINYTSSTYKTASTSPYKIIQTYTNARKIIVKEGVTTIGNYAFCGCSSSDAGVPITSITLPDSLNYWVRDYAFAYLYDLTEINWGNSTPTALSSSCFYDTPITDSMFEDIPSTIISMSSNCFYAAKTTSARLTNIDLTRFPALDTLGGSAFRYQDNLKSVTLPSTLTTIGTYTFAYTGLTTLTIPSGLTIPGYFAAYCTSLATLEMGGTQMTRYSFRNDTALTKVWIRSTCTKITNATGAAYGPFNNCSTSLKIYCEASSKPSGWTTYWNYIKSGTQATVVWGQKTRPW